MSGSTSFDLLFSKKRNNNFSNYNSYCFHSTNNFEFSHDTVNNQLQSLYHKNYQCFNVTKEVNDNMNFLMNSDEYCNFVNTTQKINNFDW